MNALWHLATQPSGVGQVDLPGMEYRLQIRDAAGTLVGAARIVITAMGQAAMKQTTTDNEVGLAVITGLEVTR